MAFVLTGMSLDGPVTWKLHLQAVMMIHTTWTLNIRSAGHMTEQMYLPCCGRVCLLSNLQNPCLCLSLLPVACASTMPIQ